jgi:hypothetical protein
MQQIHILECPHALSHTHAHAAVENIAQVVGNGPNPPIICGLARAVKNDIETCARAVSVCTQALKFAMHRLWRFTGTRALSNHKNIFFRMSSSMIMRRPCVCLPCFVRTPSYGRITVIVDTYTMVCKADLYPCGSYGRCTCVCLCIHTHTHTHILVSRRLHSLVSTHSSPPVTSICSTN